MMRGLALLLLVAGCRVHGHASPPPAPAVAPHDNRAATLAGRAAQLVAIEVVAADDRRVLGSVDAALLPALRASLGAGVREGLTATPPPWPVLLRLRLATGAPFLAHLVGHDRLRLCPHEPWRDCVARPDGTLDPDAAELAVPPELFDAVGAIVGVPPRKEYRTPPGPSPLDP